MRYVLMVKQPVYGMQGAFLAYQFAVALLEQGHQITQIFFSQAGVTNGNAFIYPANDEFNLLNAWQKLAKLHQIPLHLCIAAAQRRGIVDNMTASQPEQYNLSENFVLAGLGEFSKATLEADRIITI